MDELEVGKNYVITITTNFVGVFKEIEVDPQTGGRYAVFVQPGTTDRGGIPSRKVRTDNIVSAELARLSGN
jgi:sporulation protein YlmC with PRC-barrel domain